MDVQTIYYDSNSNLFLNEVDGLECEISDIMEIEQILYYKKVGGTVYANMYGEEFQIIFPIPTISDRTIYYCAKDNTFMDEEDNILFNIFSLITPNDLFLFKKNKKNKTIIGIDGIIVRIMYSDEYYRD